MQPLTAWFEDFLKSENRRQAITVVGSGGKTSLIWRLAASLAAPPVTFGAPSVARRTILVTPTTKMFVPSGPPKPYDLYYDGRNNKRRDGADFPNPVPGITLAGMFNETSGKLESLPLEVLAKISPRYDFSLMEGDGARELPLKAWNDDEPVIPAFTDLTIGVLPLWPLGLPVSEKIIHRLPLFLSLTGAAQGEALKPEHITRLVMGLFAKAQGKKILFFNQIEDDAAFMQAEETAALLTPEFRGELCRILAGSVKQNTLRVI